MIHLIVGNVGSGKSTLAKEISKKESAHIFHIDDWMTNLYSQDVTEDTNYEWNLERVERIESQILIESAKLDSLNLNIILDLGFFGRKQRNRVKEFLNEKNISWKMHYLDISKEVRWERVQARNAQLKESHQVEVSKEVFDFCETIFEELGESETRQSSF